MNKDSWKKLGLEIFSIVFAVLLALVLNHWREQVLDQKTSDQALTNVLVEIHTNSEELAEEAETFQVIIDTLQAQLYKIRNGEDAANGFGISFTLLSHSAWEMAQVTGAVKNFDLEFLMNVSELYEFQDICHQNGLAFIDKMNSIDYNDKGNQEAVLSSMIRQLRVQKKWVTDLKGGYDQLFLDHSDLVEEYLPDSLKVD